MRDSSAGAMNIGALGTPVLFVDDDANYARLFAHSMARHGFVVDHVPDALEARKALDRGHYEMVLVDLYLGGENLGTEVLSEVFRKFPNLPTFILTGQGSVPTAVEAMRRGAAGYIEKVASLPDIAKRMREELTRVEYSAPDESKETFGMVGKSPQFLQLLAKIHKLKAVDSTVLITGESGTGKELVARALHSGSPRSQGPFRAINCGAIPETLLESELFGHRRGAFTDARADRKGLFELCEGGTVFLDEVGEMPLSLQVKLLRVLQEREVFPLGGDRSVKVDVRIVCATNRDLKEEVRQDRFREDLYYRVSVLPIAVPPLRDRLEDIPPLIQEFLRRFNLCFQKEVAFPNDSLLSRLLAYEWPGNVRELQNVVERGVVLAEGNQLAESAMFEESHGEGPDRDPILSLPLKEAKRSFERLYLESLLKRSGGNVSKAARMAQCNRVELYRIAQRHNVSLRSLGEDVSA